MRKPTDNEHRVRVKRTFRNETNANLYGRVPWYLSRFWALAVSRKEINSLREQNNNTRTYNTYMYTRRTCIMFFARLKPVNNWLVTEKKMYKVVRTRFRTVRFVWPSAQNVRAATARFCHTFFFSFRPNKSNNPPESFTTFFCTDDSYG